MNQPLHLVDQATNADLESVPSKRLNLGAGGTEIDGFEPRDAKQGDCLYPLPDEDNSIDEIRASHVLEHFPAVDIQEIVNHWYAKLRPGGMIRIAVPDFRYVAEQYLNGRAVNVQGYIMGGQVDDDDYHKALFDGDVLTELLIRAGFERLFSWKSEIDDCAALDVSLNVGGFKPTTEARYCEHTTAVLSAPRFGPTMHFRMAYAAFRKAKVPYQPCGGAYWHQVLSQTLEDHIKDLSCKYVFTCDYDSIFEYEDVMELYRLMEVQPDADAICAMQSKRFADHALFGLRDSDDNPITTLPSYCMDMNLLPVTSGHFGLTIFRADSLRKHKRPWMVGAPNEEGEWGENRVDPDMDFWKRWRSAGLKLYLAPRVIIGHMQEMIAWPDKGSLKTIHQSMQDYNEEGMPEAVRR